MLWPEKLSVLLNYKGGVNAFTVSGNGPLRSPDPDVPLELSPALAAIYDEAAYELSVDYGQPPPPPDLSAEDAAWLEDLLSPDGA